MGSTTKQGLQALINIGQGHVMSSLPRRLFWQRIFHAHPDTPGVLMHTDAHRAAIGQDVHTATPCCCYVAPADAVDAGRGAEAS